MVASTARTTTNQEFAVKKRTTATTTTTAISSFGTSSSSRAYKATTPKVTITIQTKQKKNSVAFSPSVTMRCILHIDDYTDEEYEACWFSPEEIDEIMDDVWDTVELMESPPSTSNTMMDDKHYCRRGLEALTPQGKQRVLRNRQAARSAVFLAQELHHQSDSSDDEESSASASASASSSISISSLDERLSQAYQECTDQSKDLAYLAGISDAKTVCTFLKHAKSMSNNNTGAIGSANMMARMQRRRSSRIVNSSSGKSSNSSTIRVLPNQLFSSAA